jgi:hypothetical protein
MLRSAARRALPLLALLPTLGLTAGGWTVTTLDDLPDHFVATRPTPLAFAVRGHGKEAIGGLTARIEARSGDTRVVAPASESRMRDGHYTASLALPHGGAWVLTIHNGFGRESIELPPIAAALPREQAPAPLAAAERGRRLFVAKGCVTCHERVDVGPRLAGRRYDVAWLTRFLDHPQQVRPAPEGRPQMPRLGLSQREIASLVAFVNGGAVASR